MAALPLPLPLQRPLLGNRESEAGRDGDTIPAPAQPCPCRRGPESFPTALLPLLSAPPSSPPTWAQVPVTHRGPRAGRSSSRPDPAGFPGGVSSAGGRGKSPAGAPGWCRGRKGWWHCVIKAFLVACCLSWTFRDEVPKEGDVPWHLPELPHLHRKGGGVQIYPFLPREFLSLHSQLLYVPPRSRGSRDKTPWAWVEQTSAAPAGSDMGQDQAKGPQGPRGLPSPAGVLPHQGCPSGTH